MDSEKAVQSGDGHHDLQAAHPFDGLRKPIPPPLRPQSPLRLFPQIRQKPNDCLKSRRDIPLRPDVTPRHDQDLSPTEHQLSQESARHTASTRLLPDALILPHVSITPYDASARTSVSDSEGLDGWRINQRHQRSGGLQQQWQQSRSQSQAPGSSGITRRRTMLTSRKIRPSTADDGSGLSSAGADAKQATMMSPAVLRKTRRVNAQPS
ncbi:hypothetical protein EI94DRAFT_1798734 [Lactarius quietus]|nr:hypothetical protein EI94DRAFT_1798734 [Lactarius quietus]